MNILMDSFNSVKIIFPPERRASHWPNIDSPEYFFAYPRMWSFALLRQPGAGGYHQPVIVTVKCRRKGRSVEDFSQNACQQISDLSGSAWVVLAKEETELVVWVLCIEVYLLVWCGLLTTYFNRSPIQRYLGRNQWAHTASIFTLPWPEMEEPFCVLSDMKGFGE